MSRDWVASMYRLLTDTWYVHSQIPPVRRASPPTVALLAYPPARPASYSRKEHPVKTLFAPITWLGRVTLWIAFWPLGLWRSVRHGRKKSEARQREAFAAELKRDREERAKIG